MAEHELSDEARLCRALRKVADALEAHLYARHRPDQRGKYAREAYERDMRPVVEARAVLDAIWARRMREHRRDLADRSARLERMPDGSLRVRAAPWVHVADMDKPTCQC